MRLLHMRICVHQPLMQQSLREQISQAIVKVDESELRRKWEEFAYGVDDSRVLNGENIEIL